MNKFYCFILIIFFICFGVHGRAQTSGYLTGIVQNATGTGVGFATVTVIQETDFKLITGEVSDAAGKFRIKSPAPGRYLLRITLIGYSATDSPPFEVTGPDYNKDFGTFLLKDDTKQLKEVNIQALRPTITQQADKLVVSVEGTAMAAGNTAFAVLGKAPGVFIDQEGNIQLNGRSGVTVMLNGKLTYLSARDLRNMLEGMSSENIKDIEIITNPSAKYDAEGTSGIININLKKNTLQGMNGSTYAGSTYNFKQVGYTYGGNINYKKGNWNSMLNLDGARRVGGREATFTRIFYAENKTTYFDQTATGNFQVEGPPAVRIGTDYNFIDRHSIGFVSNFNTNYAESDFLTETYIGPAPAAANQFIDADNISSNSFTNFNTNLHYTGKLNEAGTTLSSDLDYVKIKNRGEADFYNYFTNLNTTQQTTDFLYTNTPNGFNIYSGKVDFTHPLSKEKKLELGAKASQVISDNDSRFYFNNNSLRPDPARTNHFNYRESIVAGYVNWSGTLNEHLSLQTGFRAENTSSIGHSYTTKQKTYRDYVNLFPSIFLLQKVNENYGINYSYSRRLTRPNYGSLNPFRAYRDPYTYTEGNPQLRPSYTQAFSIAQTFKKIYILTASYNYYRDMMAELPILDVANAVTIYTTGNVNNGSNVGLTGIAPLKIAKNWDSQNTVVVSYSKFSLKSDNGLLINDQLFSMIQSNQTILLPLDVKMELNLLYRGPAANGLYHMAPMHRVDVGFKKSFLDKKLDLTLNANDLFKGFRYYWTTNIDGNVNDFDQYFRWRSFGISLRYNFSSGQKIDIKRRNNSLEELNRT